ncbi:MaoC domain protein dehydratase (plasmid) [Haloterrigena turkmenica DSM 5511]|uniref:MaoC domain protein dehydratase n=1 Tax=Haloterrigena turkmenica (strain ATCC 51198 / DSM 5511 / JCM 9101 / NCIMB 13204 / VKM B-1734 / 4k) TaxID=543526 RepID=D2RZV8_HALTV|nr:MaoC family dehydratase [Haloterrigena turkmenica]ADB62655.1 MaoC domain protein dehydratase [Haloterrigena turkmenica DSM 5511]
MNYDDLSEGDSLPTRTIENIRREDTKLMAAILQDPYPPHFDHERCDELDFPGLLHQGPANLSYVLQAVSETLESPADVRSIDVRYQEMVFADQTVHAEAVVEEKRIDGDDGVVTFSVELKTAADDIVMAGTVDATVPRTDEASIE